MMFSVNAEQWATETFSDAELGDLRRTKQLVKIKASLANHIGQSIVQSLESAADIEAAYRFSRNDAIGAQAIAEAEFKATAKAARSYSCPLTLEDTTSLEFTHQTVRDEMGHTTSAKSSRGMQAHSVLLFAPQEKHVVGLIKQERWVRDIKPVWTKS